jgi:hypothetical protein
MGARAACVVLAISVTACGEEGDSLEGSVGVDLSFDRVTARLIVDDLEVRYLRDVSGGVEEVAELVVNDVGPVLTAGFEVALTQDNAAVGRSVTDGSGFPDLDEGNLEIDEGGDVGDVLRGRFGVVFASGATLSGHFSATLEEVSLP